MMQHVLHTHDALLLHAGIHEEYREFLEPIQDLLVKQARKAGVCFDPQALQPQGAALETLVLRVERVSVCAAETDGCCCAQPVLVVATGACAATECMPPFCPNLRSTHIS